MNSRLIVISHGFPSVARPNDCPFVKELTDTWKSMDVNVLVVKPVTLKEFIKLSLKKKRKDGYVCYPLYFDYTFLRAFRMIPAIRRFHIKIADKSFQRAVEKAVRITDFDILYSHFLNSGFCAAALAEKHHVPAYCAVGESTLWTLEFKDMDEVRRRMKYLSGFIAVSSKNKQMIIENNLTTEDRIRVFPNGVDLQKIHPLDKKQCRQELNIDSEVIVGVFLGHFIERKGPLRVAQATRDIPNLKMMYIGSGDQEPEGNNIIFKGKVPHNEIAKYLSAADFFVLPTLAEGCCNAIVEAMACGLPVISSDLDFNDDILDPDYSIRIAPDNIEEIRDAVLKMMKDQNLRGKMSQLAINKSKTLDLSSRAINILGYMGYADGKYIHKKSM